MADKPIIGERKAFMTNEAAAWAPWQPGGYYVRLSYYPTNRNYAVLGKEWRLSITKFSTDRG